MKILLRLIAIVFVLIGALLVGIVIKVGADPDTDLRIGVAVLYVVIAALLSAAAVWLWRRPGRRPASPAA